MPEIKRPLRVFLCHAHSDATTVRSLYTRLRREGVDVWLDKEKLLPGSDWELEIRKAVRESDVVVVCLSKQFNQAGFRQKEVRIALETAMEQPEGEIFIIPARLEECESLESLKKWHWVDLFEDNGYQRLISALRIRADRIGATLRIRRGGQGQSIKSQPKSKEFEKATESPSSEGNIGNAVIDTVTPSTPVEERSVHETIERTAQEKVEINDVEKARQEKFERENVEKADLEKAKNETFIERENAARDTLAKAKPKTLDENSVQNPHTVETTSKEPTTQRLFHIAGIKSIFFVIVLTSAILIISLLSMLNQGISPTPPTATRTLSLTFSAEANRTPSKFATPTLSSTATSTLTAIFTLTSTSILIPNRPATYTMQRGDYTYCIARRFNVNPEELLSLNGLSDGTIYYPNLTLRIPQTGSFPGNRALRNHPATYTVATSNETIHSVACVFGDVDPAAIAQANGISVGAALTSGQTLSIP